MSLYTLTNDLQQLETMLEDENCEVSKECLMDTLEAVEGEYTDKVNAYCKLIKNLKAEAEDIGEEVKRLQAKKRSREKNIERLKDTLATSMQLVGKEKIKTPLFSLYGLKQDKLCITGDVPEEYKVEYITKKNDEKAIKQALLDGKELGFAKLIGSVTVR